MAPQIVMTPEDILAQESLWIFGYGSLIWHPNFEFTERKIGFVKGYVTRFWQGSIAHRGTPDKPGRVATMIEDEEGECWGMAFKVEGTEQITKALLHLNMRECLLGGYQIQQMPFVVAKGDQEISALVFRAMPENDLFMGPDSVESAAKIVASSSGRTGHNAEYLFRLVDFMKQTVPDAKDRYLFELGSLTMELLKCKCAHRYGSNSNKASKSRSVRSKLAGKMDYYHKCYVVPSATEERTS